MLTLRAEDKKAIENIIYRIIKQNGGELQERKLFHILISLEPQEKTENEYPKF